jgi:diguanylate cyclase (GGDEF)-like protein
MDNTLTVIQENKGPLTSLIDFKELNFRDFSEYETYRLVDPTSKEVFKIINENLVKFDNKRCYDMWETGSPCKYCVSLNALESRSEKKKLEYLNGTLNIARVIPVLIEGRELVLELFQNLSSSYFKTEDRFEQISKIVEDLNTLASTESFTNLFSHSYTLNTLTTFINGDTTMERDTVSLAILDVNNLKYVNDTFGHLTGDELILKVAEILLPLKNMENVIPGRTGGDEFQIVLLNYNEEQANELLEPFFKRMSGIKLNKQDYRASVSYGLLEWNKKESDEDFINRVDKLMYENKVRSKQGRR